jgi:hypothetical protein
MGQRRDRNRQEVQASQIFEVFLCVLFAGLADAMSRAYRAGREMHTLAGFPTFCPMTFHLLASYSLMASRNAMDYAVVSMRIVLGLRVGGCTSSSANSA